MDNPWFPKAGTVILLLFVITIIVAHFPDCPGDAHGEDEVPTHHEQWCENIDGWCPTVTNGIHAGKKWCNSPKKKCYTSHRNRSYDIYMALKDWFNLYPSGKHGLFKSGTIRTESELTWDSKTSSSTEECGIASVDRSKAKKWNINACDPEANLWAAQSMDASRLIRMREKYPELELAPLSDQWKIAGAGGAIGSNKVYNLIKGSGALRLKKGEDILVYKHPHDRIMKWLVWKDKSDPSFFYNFMAIPLLGKNQGKGAFRLARSEGQENLFEDLFVHGLESAYGEPTMPARPLGAYPFPDNAKHHCQCWRWPELADVMPTPHTVGVDVIDPRLL